jgi:CRP-like cAMP-binding protein
MYVIGDGRVRVHDGDRTLVILGKQCVFGEMAVLDDEPRSASVTAMEPTCIFLLDRNTFDRLVATREEVMRGIARVVAQHLRARTREMAQDHRSMQEFGQEARLHQGDMRIEIDTAKQARQVLEITGTDYFQQFPVLRKPRLLGPVRRLDACHALEP